MGKRMNYFDYAENDYFFYRANYEEHRIGNAMCSSAQGICERYLKHLVDIYCTDEDTTSVLRTSFLLTRRTLRFAGKRWRRFASV